MDSAARRKLSDDQDDYWGRLLTMKSLSRVACGDGEERIGDGKVT